MPRRLVRYVREAFAPAVHAPFAALWYGAAAGWPATPRLALGLAHAVLVLLALRVIDDWKDEPYDRRHHPERPLPSGRVAPRDLAGLLGLVVVALVAVNAALGAPFLALTLGQFAFACLMALARRGGTFLVRHWVLEVLLVQPLNLALTAHALWLGDGGLAVVAACSGAILQLEVLRKTALVPRPGEELYSNLAGPGPSFVAAWLLAGLATAGMVALLGPLALLPLVLHGAALLLPVGRRRRGAVGVAFLVVVLALLGGR
ncbi:MAG: hypothetical protein M9894_17455 [Planctomycetes bacterium]|nr:hypothetical protein [Planctomycetota bacterium]